MYSVRSHYHGAKCAASHEKALKVNRRRRIDGAGF